MKVFPCLFLVFHRVLCKDKSDIWLQHETTDVTYGTSTPLEGAQSTFQCLLTCSASEGCESVNVKPDNFQCELSPHHPTEGGLTENQRPGWTVYYRGLWNFIYWGTIHCFSRGFILNRSSLNHSSKVLEVSNQFLLIIYIFVCRPIFRRENILLSVVHLLAHDFVPA
jgi:hypothetical protein